MKRIYRGRPPLDHCLIDVLESVRRLRNVTTSARYLGCSDDRIHITFKSMGLSLAPGREAPNLESTFPNRMSTPR
jgi:hypothetical protein